MARLAQVGFALVEVFGLEQGGGAFDGRRGQDGRVHVDEAVQFEPLADGRDDSAAHAQDGPLAGHADPQVAVVEGKIHAVLFERHRVILGGGLDDFYLLDADLIPTGDSGCALVLAHRSADDDGGFLRQTGELVEERLGQVAFERHTLDEAASISYQKEDQFAFVGAAVDPAFDLDFLTCVFRDLFNTDGFHNLSLRSGNQAIR